MRLEELRTRTYVEGAYTRALVPLGSCESHGDHLPFGTDAIIAQDLASAIAARLERTIVLPPLWFGMSELYRHLPMAISLAPETLTSVIGDIFDSLAHWGIREAIVINGHDGNLPSLEIAARKARLRHPELRIAALATWWSTVIKLLPRETFGAAGGMGHGGEGETSLAMEVIPELVEAPPEGGRFPDTDRHVTQFWTFSELSDRGFTGDPSRATREKGALMKKALVDYVVEFVRRMERTGWSYGKGEVLR